MALLNTTIHCLDTKKTLLNWTVIGLNEVEYSFHEYFASISWRLPKNAQYTLQRVQIGVSKDVLDNADKHLKVVAVTKNFGKFVKLLVKTNTT